MNNNQDRYDELDNIVRTLEVLISETDDKYFNDAFRELIYEAQEEMKELEEILREQYEREEREANEQYERSRI